MAEKRDLLIQKMIRFETGCPKRIQHFLKVEAFASLIGRMEGIPPLQQEILETAAIVHDCGILPALERYQSSAGPYQEKEGMPVAEAMLKELSYSAQIVDRVVYLVGHHHTYTNIDDLDYQILVEADFLVNLFENDSSMDTILHAQEHIFRTESGRRILKEMFGV